MPVMAAWNIDASPRVLTEARVRIPAPARVQPCVRSLRGALRARRRVRGAALRPPPVRGRTGPRPFTNTIHVPSEAFLRAFAGPLEATHEVPDDVSLPTGRAPGRRTGRHRPAPGGRHDHRLADPPIGAAGRWDNSGPRASRVPPPGKSGAWGRNLRRWPGPGRPRAPAPGLERPVSRPAPLTAPAGRPRWGPGGAPLPQAGRRAYMSWTSAAWKRATWCVGGSGSS